MSSTLEFGASESRVFGDADNPLNMGLNEGTYSPAACNEVFERFANREACRRYSSSDNLPLKEFLAEEHGVSPGYIFLGHGSGPLLKEALIMIIKSNVLKAPTRMAKYVLRRGGYPIITPVPSYSKVAAGAIRNNLALRTLALDASTNWELDLDQLQDAIKEQDGLVYLCNPNNPTGNVLIRRHELISLLERFPRSTFWVDEAYVQYVEPSADLRVADLILRYPNLIVSRSFSFAYGLAAVRLGYLVASPKIISKLEKKHVPYRQGLFQEELALAALKDEDHLPFVREQSKLARDLVCDAFADHEVIEVFPSQTHYLLCRFRDGRSARPFVAQMRRNGIALRLFEPVKEHSFEHYFRITLGTQPENMFLIETMKRVLG